MTDVFTHSFPLPLAGCCGDPNRHFLAKQGDVLLGINLNNKQREKDFESALPKTGVPIATDLS